MINKLTKAQEKKMETVKNKWLSMLFDCQLKTDRKKATKAINWLYELSGCKNPKIVFLSSPLACQFGCNLLKNVHGYQVGYQVWDQVWDQVGDQVGYQVRNQVWDQIKENGMDFFDFCSYGSIFDYGWISFYDYFKDVVKYKKESLNKLYKFILLLKSGIYDMIQFEKIVFVSDMPTKIVRNQQNRLHNTKGMAIEWSDGFGLYFINGVAFNQELFKKVTNPEIHPKDIFAIENQEQRRVAYEIMPKANMLKLDKYEVVDEVVDDGYGNPMKLFTFSVGVFDKPFRYVNWFCPSTKREYFHDISGTDIRDCWEAKQHSFRVNYKFDQEF